MRNMDLVRELLLALDAKGFPPNGYYSLNDANDLQIEGNEWRDIEHHLALLYDAGYYDSYIPKPHWRKFRMLTWAGHDFLDSVRDQDTWEKTKKRAKKVGGFTVDILAKIAKGIIETKIEKLSGVKIDI